MFASEHEFESCPGLKHPGNARNPHLQRSVKRCIDLLGAGILIVVLFPVLIVIGLLVVLDDGWPFIYRRRVVGTTGEFDAFKFRTMIRDADSILAANPALKAEFVLRGQMSLVGPRMITAAELDKYGPYKQLLLSLKPGLTGYWQVRGRQNVCYEDRVQMDLHYIEKWSLSMDLKILFETPRKVLKREGAF